MISVCASVTGSTLTFLQPPLSTPVTRQKLRHLRVCNFVYLTCDTCDTVCMYSDQTNQLPWNGTWNCDSRPSFITSITYRILFKKNIFPYNEIFYLMCTTHFWSTMYGRHFNLTIYIRVSKLHAFTYHCPPQLRLLHHHSSSN